MKPQALPAKKKTAIRFIAVIGGLFVLLLALNLILDSGVLNKLLKEEETEEHTPIFLFNPDYEENIFEDEVYMDLNRYILYTDGAMSIYLANENDFQSTGELAIFFGEYFDAVINGDYERYNTFFTEEYLQKNGKKERFTMQKLFNMEVIKLSEYTLNEGTSEQIDVFEFKVGYCIRRNNGTFRDDVESNASKPQIYQLYRSIATGEILIQSISNYNIK